MSRSSLTKQQAFQAAPEVIPILDGSCTRLKKLLKLCDQQIDSIEHDSGMPSHAKVKELQILVRMVLNLQKDLLKYTKSLYPDVPVKQPPAKTDKLRDEDLEALSDSQLHELISYLTQDDEENEVDIQEIIDTMLNRSRFPEQGTEEKAPPEIETANNPYPKQNTSPLELKVNSQQDETRKPFYRDTWTYVPPGGTKGRDDQRPINPQQPPRGTQQPDARKDHKPPHGPTRDPNTE